MSKLVTHNLPGCRLVAATDGHWHRARRTKPPTPAVPVPSGSPVQWSRTADESGSLVHVNQRKEFHMHIYSIK